MMPKFDDDVKISNMCLRNKLALLILTNQTPGNIPKPEKINNNYEDERKEGI